MSQESDGNPNRHKRFIRNYDEEYLLRDLRDKRVAIYARTSTRNEESHKSMINQVSNLKERIERRPDWQLADIYVDEGVSGTKMNRPELNRLMQDARDGKLDIIITKSISRFGRNFTGVMKAVRELKSQGIKIFFESDNLYVTNENAYSIMIMQMKIATAERVAENNSKNQKWSIERRYAMGAFPSYIKLYGYDVLERRLIIKPAEAEVVKRIFEMYLSGYGRNRICKVLNKESIPSPNGNKWQQATILNILSNEKYTGNMILWKTFIANPITKKRVKNDGEHQRYLLTNTHEAIIDQTTYYKTQLEIARRAEAHQKIVTAKEPNDPTESNSLSLSNPSPPRVASSSYYIPEDKTPRKIFYHLLVCPYCHKYYNYHGKVPGATKGVYRTLWQCRDYMQYGRSYCPNKCIPEEQLVKCTRTVLQEQGLIRQPKNKPPVPITNELLSRHIKTIISRKDQMLEFHLHNGKIITKHWRINRYKSWTLEMRERARQQTLKRLAAKKQGSQ